MQTRFLVTIYRKLTAALIDCRRFGNHWEDVGFQGTDPATDLRGVGLLGLLQLLFLILSSETSQLCKEIYRLSLDKRQHFPFAVMSTNVTQIALQVLREGLLNKEFFTVCTKSGGKATKQSLIPVMSSEVLRQLF